MILKRFEKNFILISFISMICMTSFISFYYIHDNQIKKDTHEILLPKLSAQEIHLSPLVIDESGNGNFTWEEASSKGWCKGSGTWIDPYIIENVSINGQNTFSCIEIRASNRHFIIRNCKFYNGSTGIKLTNATNGLLLINNCSNNIGNGIYLSQSQNITISENLANNIINFGIIIEYSNNNTVSENIANYNNKSGIKLYLSNYNVIKENSVNNNNIAGIALTDSYNNLIINNNETINFNGIYGIILVYSNYNSITKNVINYNEIFGIYLLESNYNSITENTLIGNKKKAILEENCMDNSIEDNIIPKGRGTIPWELIILFSVIGAIAIVVPASLIVYKKKISRPKEEKIVKLKLTKEEIEDKEKLKIERKSEKEKLSIEKQKKKIEDKLRKKMNFVDHLHRENNLTLALKNLNKIENIARSHDLIDFLKEAEQKKNAIKKQELETTNRIKQTILNLSMKFSRLQLTDISEKSAIKDEAIIEEVIQDMIRNKEIQGEYFQSSKALALDVAAPLISPEKETDLNVFLSYSTLNTDYFQISRLVKRLESYPEIDNVLYWEVDSKQNIVEFMEETLNKTQVFVLFCSENSLKSEAVKGEWQSAYQMLKKGLMKIIPVYEDEDHIPKLLWQMLNVKFTKDDFEGFIQKLHEEILR